GSSPAAIVVEVRGAGTRSGDADLDLDWAIRGGELDPPVGGPAPAQPLARCNELPVAPRSLCRVQALVDRAAARRDVLLYQCARAKLDAMRPLADIAGAGPAKPE